MIQILIVNQSVVPHYRIPIYNYLGNYLHRYGFNLMVVASGIQAGNPFPTEFQFYEIPLSIITLTKFFRTHQIDVIISWVDMKHLFLFPMYIIAKGIMGKKMIYWGQGRDLLDKNARVKNLAYTLEQSFCDAIILYAEHLKKYVKKRFHKKLFIANNTLCISYRGLSSQKKEAVLSQYGIFTPKNIICIGRIQKRKRIDQLIKAFYYLNRPDIGLIIVGPDTEGILNNLKLKNIYRLGPIYGNKKYDLLAACEVACIPGAVGLSIVDAFHCGLPFITETGDESAEIMYLKDGVNGFLVQKGNVTEMAHKLQILLDDDNIRSLFSIKAKKEVQENADINNLCKGFLKALLFVTSKLVI